MKTSLFLLVIGAITVSSPISSQEISTKELKMKNHATSKKAPIMLIGIECRTSNAPDAAPHDIPKHWEKFYQENVMANIPNKTSNEVFAVYCDYEGDYTKPYSLVIGCQVSSLDNIPKGMVAKTIPGGSYAKFRAIGEHPKTLIETWQHIWKQQDLKRVYTSDYEVYGERFMSGSPQEVDVFIAVEN